MSIMELWKETNKTTISFEFFPARDEKSARKLDVVVDKLADLQPDFVSVTFGAGGSTREGSLELIKKLKREKKLQLIPYLAAYGLSLDNIAAIVENYIALSIEGLLCVRGDKPEGVDGFTPHPDSFPHASDLLTFLRRNTDLLLGAACYPEGHKEAESLERDLDYLKLKVEKGARFFISQYAYDNDFYYKFIDQCRQAEIHVPIVAGIMPVYNLKMTENLAALCGATITPGLRRGLAELPADDKQAVTAFGIDFALQQCRDLLRYGLDGLHFYTMDRAKSVSAIVTRLREEGLL